MGRTKDPHAASIQAWRTRARESGGSESIQQGTDWSGRLSDESAEFPETRDHKAFIAARDSHPMAAFMSPLSEDDLKGRRVFMSKDRKTGYTIDENGDFGNLFNLPGGEAGRGSRAIIEGVQRGAKTLDCYDGHLTKLYVQHGFVPVARIKFNREYAPEGWDYDRFDNPDVVFMRYSGGDPRLLKARAGQFPKVKSNVAPYVDSYEAGQTAARSTT